MLASTYGREVAFQRKLFAPFHWIIWLGYWVSRQVWSSFEWEFKARQVGAAYLTDIFEKMNNVNIRLQGNQMNIIKAKGITSSFIAKFDMLGKYWLINFPTLKRFSVSVSVKTPELPEGKILIFTWPVKKLHVIKIWKFDQDTNSGLDSRSILVWSCG